MGRKNLLVAGSVLGFGLGGFFDGIMLHQLLLWHRFVSGIIPDAIVQGLHENSLWNGIFHSTTCGITALGLLLFWRAVTAPDALLSPRGVFGAVVIGFGIFHLFDSVVNYWLLQLYHLRPGPTVLLYDMVFFALGMVLLLAGWVLVRTWEVETSR
ncbi:MAG: DUF2243 domain-containing protein [Chloroflexi bacterium]|nr:DUF2243 domain-containing protein [Chloroflexota bacterium]